MEEVRKAVSPRVIVLVLLVVVVVRLSPLLITRRWSWWEAWVYALAATASFAVSGALAARRNPDLLAERAWSLRQGDAESWDKLLSPLVGAGSDLIPIVAGLDVLLGWSSPYSLPLELLGLALILGGYVPASSALIENRFFSGTVRIQSERGHQVATGGPHRWARRPGYVGGLLACVGSPLLLDWR